MPFTFFAHQAAVLPLKLWRPRWFAGTALVFGSMAPDAEYFLRGRTISTLGHTALGQVAFCLPLTLLMVWLFRKVMVLPLALHLPGLRAFAGLHRADGPNYWRRAIFSALVGSVSHVAWDSLTHAYGYTVLRVALLRAPLFELSGYTVKVYKVLQHGSTVVGGLATLLVLYLLVRRGLLPEGPKAEPTEQSRRWMSRGLPAIALIAMVASALTAGWSQGTVLAVVAFGLRMVTIGGLLLALLCSQVQRRMCFEGASSASE